MVEQYFGEWATSAQQTQKRLTSRNFRSPLELSNDGTQLTLRTLRIPTPPSGGTLSDMETWAAQLYAALRTWGVLK